MTATSMTMFIEFWLVCLVLVTVPFIPAFREWRRPTDMSALRVLPDYTNDIDHFARRLRKDVAGVLGEGEPTAYQDFDVMTGPFEQVDFTQAKKRMIVKGSMEMDKPLRVTQPLFVKGDLRAGPGSVVSAIYASGDLELGADSEVHDWAHADGIMTLGANTMALRRVSSAVAIEMDEGTWFERVNAPTLRFGLDAAAPPLRAEPDQIVGNYMDLPDVIQQAPNVYLIRGNCVLPPGRLYNGSLVVTGHLAIGEGTTVNGSVKARKAISIAARGAVNGAITCEERIYAFDGSYIMGPVVSETDILIGSGSTVGAIDGNTTITAKNIIVETGAVVHGTVWAHEIGMVRQP